MASETLASRTGERPGGAVEQVLGCKWTAAVLREIEAGTRRPGALRRAIPGLSTKVLNERLAKLVRLGFLERHAYPEIPPRVEYRFTAAGERLVRLLDEIDAIDAELAAGGAPPPAPGAGKE